MWERFLYLIPSCETDPHTVKMILQHDGKSSVCWTETEFLIIYLRSRAPRHNNQPLSQKKSCIFFFLCFQSSLRLIYFSNVFRNSIISSRRRLIFSSPASFPYEYFTMRWACAEHFHCGPWKRHETGTRMEIILKLLTVCFLSAFSVATLTKTEKRKQNQNRNINLCILYAQDNWICCIEGDCFQIKMDKRI